MADFRRRGFRHDRPAARVLERRARSFLTGYNLLRRHGAGEVGAQLTGYPLDDLGFAYEGAGFAAAAADLTGRSRHGGMLATLLEAAGDRFPHLIHVGAGWVGLLAPAGAALRRPALHPLLRWLTLDGCGFARAFLRSPRWLSRLSARPWPVDPVHAVLYQGVGRCMWFMECADVQAIRRRIARFPVAAHSELWAGVGLAASYAGGADGTDLANLVSLTGAHRHALAQGAAFAAGARQVSGHMPDYTSSALPVIAGVPAEVAAEWTETALPGQADGSGGIEDYRTWQTRIRALAAEHC